MRLNGPIRKLQQQVKVLSSLKNTLGEKDNHDNFDNTIERNKSQCFGEIRETKKEPRQCQAIQRRLDLRNNERKFFSKVDRKNTKKSAKLFQKNNRG